MYAEPKSWFSKDWTVHADDGRTVVLDLATWREGAELELNAETYSYSKAGAFSREFFLRQRDRLLARAEKPSLWRNRFEVDYEGKIYVLEKASIFGRSFVIRSSESTIGSIRPLGLFTRKSEIELPSGWPLPVRLFFFWLVLIIWHREDGGS